MPFDTLTPRMRQVAESGKRFLADRYGQNVKVETEIDNALRWKPTFYIKTTTQVIAAEASELLFPEILRIVGLDLVNFSTPIAVHVVCPSEVFQTKAATELRRNGIGLILVDENGDVTQPIPCVAIQQHIPEARFEDGIRGMGTKLRNKLRAAHTVYVGDASQGLQKAGQVVEALINVLASESVRLNYTPKGILRDGAADALDKLWQLQQFEHHRAALGGAREFMREFRNLASHPPRSKQAALERINKARDGFLAAIRVSRNLESTAKKLKMRISLH